MKNLFILVILLLVNSNTKAQDTLTNKLQFTGATVASGNGAVTSGLYLFSYFENKKANIYFTISANDIEISYLYKIAKNKINIGPNIGYFYNVPYVSVQSFTNFSKYFSTLHWYGYSFGKPESVIQTKPTFLFFLNQGNIILGNIKFSYTLINYLDNKPIHTVTSVYTQKISKKFSIYTEFGWNFATKSQLLLAGIQFNK